MNKRKISLLLVGVLLVVFVTIGISYAVWSLNLKQEGTNTISTGCFNVTFSGINDINLQGAYPISDEEGASLTPYEFTITNTCDNAATYQINLEILNDSTLTELGIMKELLQEKGTTGTSKILTSNNIVDKTLDNASSSYKLETGLLYKNESKTFELRLWMDENTEAVDSVMNKTLNSKITVTTSYIDINTTNMMVAMDMRIEDKSSVKNLTYTQNNKYKLSSISFEKVLNPYENAVEVVDFSVNQDRSVLGYYVLNEGDKYDLYIQADGKIKANRDASYYFSGLENNLQLYGLENVDTSEVTNMSDMFSGSSITSPDLSSFDTSNVTNMSGMFSGSSITSLDLSSFDTRNVTNMSFMFNGMNSITSLDLSSFDTSNVTNMSYMFSVMDSITSLDLSSLDTSNVTDMSNMFYFMRSLINLDLSNFNTSKVTNMMYMFSYIPNLTSLDLSSFDTSKVTNMSDMFSGMSSLMNLDLSNFNTSKVTAMSHMFSRMSSITSLDLSSFDTNNVTDMRSMFSGMSSITSLDLSSLDTSNVTAMSFMFKDSGNLTEIIYGPKFMHKNNADVWLMFKNCPANLPTDTSWEGVL